MKRWRIYNRKVLVDPLQMRFAGVAVCHFTIIVLIFITTLFVPVIIRLQGGEITEPGVQAAAHEFLVLHDRLWIPLLGSLVLIVLHNILFTHRIAGPLFRFRPYLKAVGEGDLSASIKFRKRDHLKKEAEVASEMVESLREKISQADGQLGELEKTWTDLRTELSRDAIATLEKKIDGMSREIDRCRESLSVFKLRP
ncbi:MAG: hypothetical protein JW814_09530 [Candidatus Krumholzibacteriota bacterium]|nr:hypothetical protein [Candidatus Krumholzibacteriota bacterium]